jgi:hypothetical protein
MRGLVCSLLTIIGLVSHALAATACAVVLSVTDVTVFQEARKTVLSPLGYQKLSQLLIQSADSDSARSIDDWLIHPNYFSLIEEPLHKFAKGLSTIPEAPQLGKTVQAVQHKGSAYKRVLEKNAKFIDRPNRLYPIQLLQNGQ